MRRRAPFPFPFAALLVAPLAGAQEPSSVEPLVHEAVVAAPVQEAWRAFTTDEGFRKLGVAKASIDLRVGGLMKTAYDAATDLDGTKAIRNAILAFEPPRMIAFRIDRPPDGFPFQTAWKETWTVVTLTDLGDGRTSVRIAMLGFGADAESQAMRRFFDAGNAWVLKTLQAGYDATAAEPARAAHAADPLAPIEVAAVVQTTRDEAFRAYSTAEGWKAFFGVRLRVEPVPGGPFEIWFDDAAPEGSRGSEGCTVLSVDPGRMLSHSWSAPPKFPFARSLRSWVVVTFEEVSPSATRVRLRHLGFAELAASHPDHAEELAETREYFAQAWPRVLGAMKAHFDAGTPVGAP